MVHEKIIVEKSKLEKKLNKINELLTLEKDTNRDDYDVLINCWAILPNDENTNKIITKLKNDDVYTVMNVLKELKLLNEQKTLEIIRSDDLKHKINKMLEKYC